ncbi:Sortilin, neurotensin receptor 3 [Neorhodopirellula lusitana]|uniref:Sortilin, neurotensin receptor 3 n=1 Tax=Neorhodopirellula lusitana TaxID=445327 RepID=A0ABY1QSD0_9BACT|nr:Sortilin, neurotensin receptor 3 [Neorhodopirellula lusitana]
MNPRRTKITLLCALTLGVLTHSERCWSQATTRESIFSDGDVALATSDNSTGLVGTTETQPRDSGPRDSGPRNSGPRNSGPRNRALVHKSAEELAQTLRLRSLGPTFKPGRIAEIAVDPTDRSTWYVAHGAGGLWKTTNAGISWKPIFDAGGSHSLGDVIVDARNPDVIWLGTGESISNRSVGFGDGIYKSNDGGTTWAQMGLSDSQHIGKIVIDPRDSNVVYVAAEGPLWSSGGDRGLYKTVDGGKTWDTVLEISDDTGVTDLAIDPQDPETLYASSYQRRRRVGQLIGGGPETAIYKSTNGGETWKQLEEGIPSVDKGRIALAVSPQNSDVVYAVIAAAGDESGFFRSTDRGETWTRMSDYKVIDPQYYGEVYADPHHFDRIYVMDMRIHVSDNGGQTFEPLRWDMHVDNHAMVFDPDDPDHLLVGNDGGLYESYDSGGGWRHFTNLPTTQFYRVALDNAEPFYNVYGGTQDNGSMAGPSRTVNRVGIRTSEWIGTRGGDGFQSRVDPDDSDTIYTLSQNGDLARLSKRTGQNEGIRPRLEEGEPGVRWHWDSPLIISPHSSTRLYFAGSRLFRSDDRGDNWRAVSDDLTRQLDAGTSPIMGRVWNDDAVQKNRFTTALSVITALDESPISPGLLLVGTDDGLLQISENDGEDWQRMEVFPQVPEGTYVSDVCASAHDAGTLYVALNNHQRGDFSPYLLSSNDLGKTWRSISADLPERHGVWCVIEDHLDRDLLFVGTEFGLFFTVDGGAHWIPLKNGVPPIAFRDLAIQRRDSDLVAATFGRGFFVLDDMSALRHFHADDLAGEGRLMSPRSVWVYDEIGYVEAAYGNEATPNPAFGSMLRYYLRDGLPKGEGNRITLSIESPDGSSVRTLAGPTTAGFHSVQWDLRRERSSDGNRSRGQRRRAGPLVEPGEYRIKLLQETDGEQRILGEVRSLRVKALPDRQ